MATAEVRAANSHFFISPMCPNYEYLLQAEDFFRTLCKEELPIELVICSDVQALSSKTD